MSLQGTLETFALPDVLALLAATKKTGELTVTSGGVDGRIWLDSGEAVGARVPRAASVVDAVFELLRLSNGTFSFDAGSIPPERIEPVAIDGLLAEAGRRLGEWQAIEAVVPSLACPVRLAPELPADSVSVSRARWKALVAVAAGGHVGGVMDRLGLGEFEASRTVKDLVDAGLVKVEPAPPAPAKPAAAPPAPAAAARPPAAERPAPPGADRGPAPAAAPPAPRRVPSPGPADEAPPLATRRPTPVAEAAPTAPAAHAASRPAPARRLPQAGAPGERPGAPGKGEAAPSREEAEELVHQLASLGRARGRDTAPAEEDGGEEPRKGQHAKARPDGKAEGKADDDKPGQPGARPDEEPINRGMLLKFLSSVRP